MTTIDGGSGFTIIMNKNNNDHEINSLVYHRSGSSRYGKQYSVQTLQKKIRKVDKLLASIVAEHHATNTELPHHFHKLSLKSAKYSLGLQVFDEEVRKRYNNKGRNDCGETPIMADDIKVYSINGNNNTREDGDDGAIHAVNDQSKDSSDIELRKKIKRVNCIINKLTNDHVLNVKERNYYRNLLKKRAEYAASLVDRKRKSQLFSRQEEEYDQIQEYSPIKESSSSSSTPTTEYISHIINNNTSKEIFHQPTLPENISSSTRRSRIGRNPNDSFDGDNNDTSHIQQTASYIVQIRKNIKQINKTITNDMSKNGNIDCSSNEYYNQLRTKRAKYVVKLEQKTKEMSLLNRHNNKKEDMIQKNKWKNKSLYQNFQKLEDITESTSSCFTETTIATTYIGDDDDDDDDDDDEKLYDTIVITPMNDTKKSSKKKEYSYNILLQKLKKIDRLLKEHNVVPTFNNNKNKDRNDDGNHNNNNRHNYNQLLIKRMEYIHLLSRTKQFKEHKSLKDIPVEIRRDIPEHIFIQTSV